MTTPTPEADLRAYLDAVYGTTEGQAHIAVGSDPYLNAKGKYRHHGWIQSHFAWPGEGDLMVKEILREALDSDVYACPNLMVADKRSQGAAAQRRLVHADYDGDLDIEKVRAVAGFAISSGTPGHAHVYVRVTEPVTFSQHQTLCKALGKFLGSDADSKITDNDVLRPPGTQSHKPTVRDLDPVPVEWLVRPGGAVETADLARILDVNLGAAGGAANGSGPTSTSFGCENEPPPGGLAHYPRVTAAIANVTGDRSTDIATIVAACVDSNLELPHARWCVGQRRDLLTKLAEQGSRDDVLILYVKWTNERQRARREKPGSTPGTYFDPNTDDGGGTATEKPKVFGDVRHLEGDFWNRPSLKQIYDAALARMCPPWAVLAYCAGRALYLVPPSVGLPPLIGGGKGSLNWFAIAIDDSGGGKSAAASVAEELVAPMLPARIEARNIGSGEGITVQYVKPPEAKGQPPTRHDAIMFICDEIDTLTAMNQRQGATTLATLRTAFTGGTLGFAYATKGRDAHLVGHTYRMTFIINAQPSRCGKLMDDHGGGTPQRFQWFPASDPRISKAKSDYTNLIQPLALPHGLATLGDRTIDIPPDAADLILTAREQRGQGQQDALDSHALFVREKFAYALALLDGRTEMTVEDWQLSGVAAAVSDHMRAEVVKKIEQSQRREAADVGVLRGVSQEAADNEKANVQIDRVHKMLRKVLAWLDDAGGRMKNRDLTLKVSGRDRAAFEPALKLGREVRQIKLLDDGVTWEKVAK